MTSIPVFRWAELPGATLDDRYSSVSHAWRIGPIANRNHDGAGTFGLPGQFIDDARHKLRPAFRRDYDTDAHGREGRQLVRDTELDYRTTR